MSTEIIPMGTDLKAAEGCQEGRRRATEEPTADLILQGADLLTHGRLGQKVLPGPLVKLPTVATLWNALIWSIFIRMPYGLDHEISFDLIIKSP